MSDSDTQMCLNLNTRTPQVDLVKFWSLSTPNLQFVWESPALTDADHVHFSSFKVLTNLSRAAEELTRKKRSSDPRTPMLSNSETLGVTPHCPLSSLVVVKHLDDLSSSPGGVTHT